MINNNDKAYIFLSYINLGYKKVNEILDYFGQGSDFLYALKDNENIFLKKEFGKLYDEYKSKLLNFSFDTLEKYFETSAVNYITIEDDKYPSCLLQLDQPPFILYYKGDISLLNNDCIAVVGTRSPTFYGKDVTTKLTKVLCEEGFTIVSGLAMGVDKVAHETTLKNNGKTIAVLGNGFLNMYPAMNKNLSDQIVEQGGLLLTEYYPSFKASNYSFPARNRIIAALSKGVLITEAAKKKWNMVYQRFCNRVG